MCTVTATHAQCPQHVHSVHKVCAESIMCAVSLQQVHSVHGMCTVCAARAKCLQLVRSVCNACTREVYAQCLQCVHSGYDVFNV